MPRLRRILLFLLLGAVVNLLVALACAKWETRPNANAIQLMRGTNENAVPNEAKEFLTEGLVVNPPLPSGVFRFRQTSLSNFGVTRTAHTPTAAYFFDHRQRGDSNGAMRTSVSHAFGLPMRSMQFSSREECIPGLDRFDNSSRVPGWRGGWPILDPEKPSNDQFVTCQRIIGKDMDRVLYPQAVIYPLDPLPLGFTINTLFYAALLFLPFATFTTLRRRRRIRRNLCPSCGYSLAGAIPTNNSITCPECGKPSA